MFLVDCPEIGDCMGAEVNIANQIGIMNAVHKAKEVVPLIFFTPNGGDRSQSK